MTHEYLIRSDEYLYWNTCQNKLALFFNKEGGQLGFSQKRAQVKGGEIQKPGKNRI